MFPLAHLGIGSAIARPIARKLPFRWLLLGTLLPDLIDKPSFLAMGLYQHFTTGGWIPGKRGLAHTLLFLAVLTMISIWRRSPGWGAAAVGAATHLLLDFFSKTDLSGHLNSDVLTVLLWPFLGWHFPTLSYGMHGTVTLAFELLGAVLLVLQLAVRQFKPRVM